MKGNGRIIIFVAIMVVIVVFVLLNMTLFTINTISVENEVYSAYIDQSGIIDASGINKGRNIFFLSEKTVVSNIEKAYPYLKVINVERKFPSKVVIHVDMRQGTMSIPTQEDGVYVIVDGELKVLELASPDSTSYSQATHVTGIALPDPTVGTDAFASSNEYKQCLTSVSKIAVGEGLEFAGFFSTIRFADQTLYVTLRTGVSIRVDDWRSADITSSLRYALEKYKKMDEQDFRRRQGFIYHDNTLGWNWRSEDVN